MLKMLDSTVGCLCSAEIWDKRTKAKREWHLYTKIKGHPFVHHIKRPYDKIAPGVPFPKFVTNIKYYKLIPSYPDKTKFFQAFTLTELGTAIPEVVESYEAWYNNYPPYELNHE